MASKPDKPIIETTIKQNPLLQETGIIPKQPDIFTAKNTTTPPPQGPTISVEELQNDIQKRNQIILERLRLENAQIADYISILKNQKRTDQTTLEYNSYYFELLNKIYTPLFFVYLLCLIVLGFVFFMTDSDLSMSMRILLMCVFIIYPFIIETLEDYISSLFAFFFRSMRFTPQGTNPIKTATESQPFLYSQRFGIMDTST